jgi:branched-chain amino acid transport system ATP-binding protein
VSAVISHAPDPSAAGVGEPVLEVRGLHAGYGRHVILRDISLIVPRASIVAVVGPNGAGKSTLMRAISGSASVYQGEVVLSHRDITHAKPHTRFASGLCHIPEGRGIFRSLTVRENLMIQAAKGAEQKALEKAAQAFPILGKRLSQTAGTMSGGEQQMLALAAAYVRDSTVVLVDEPSLGLAPIIVDEIYEFLKRIPAEGKSVLVVDQFARKVLTVVSYVYLMQSGSIVLTGDAGEVAKNDLFAHYLGSSE